MIEAAFKRAEEATAAVLAYAGVDVPPEMVDTWSDEQVQEAEEWAAAVYLAASDPKVCVPKMPLFLCAFAPGHSGAGA